MIPKMITAEEARALTVSFEDAIAHHMTEWTNLFNRYVEEEAKPRPGKEGKHETFFKMSTGVATDHSPVMTARRRFVQQVEDAGFKIDLHDQGDFGDVFIYKISWKK